MKAARPKAKASTKKKPPVAKPTPAEHRVAVSGVAVAVSYGKSRTELFELRGTAMLNVGAPEAMVRTTGLVVMQAGKGGRNELVYNPTSLNQNLMLSLTVSDADLSLLREIFVTGTGSEAADPALVIWATTARPVRADAFDQLPVAEFSFRLDFAPEPMAPR